MRVLGEAGQVVLGTIVPKIVQQQERVEVGGVPEAERAAQMHSGALERRPGLGEALHGSERT
jgi:hypothetical protein